MRFTRTSLRATFVSMVAMLLFGAAQASAAGNAGYTTTANGEGACLNGPGVINCNHYAEKDDVFMNGGPSGGNGLADGDYYFVVLAPGSQHGGFIDGADGNLSDTTASDGGPGGGDLMGNRKFAVTDGEISTNYGGHTNGTQVDLGRPVISLAPYDDTPNPGGVYILAICEWGADSPSDCKYDAFKVDERDTPPPPPTEFADDLVVTKNAVPAFDRSYTWNIDKSVDKTYVEQVGGSVTFNYTVGVTRNVAVDNNWVVTGTIDVLNPNAGAVSDVDVTDAITDGPATCVVTGGENATIDANSQASFDYTCTYTAAPQDNDELNTATATWPTQQVAGETLTGSSATFDVPFSFDDASPGNPTVIDDCVTVSDVFNGNPPEGLNGGAQICSAGLTELEYSRTIPVQFGCVQYDNTATFTTDDTGTTGSDGESVTVCGPVETGAHTIGFWQNKNGQGIIKSDTSTNGVCDLTTWLRQYEPFMNLSATATCTQVAAYVTGVIKAATCDGTCYPMLKAQMLATALNVYFSDPALGGNKLDAPQPLGGVTIDISDWSAGFGGATEMTVSEMLQYASDQYVSSSSWYANKTQVVAAKSAFDAINNEAAFAP